ncbi:hypothetical protein [Streptomyces cavernae]|uniref:hypothetical protein n=1 Tax=Streptomyces cavernae TaxID=2259034 RepID=UPI00192E4266|nr:hypothetical protein [Streptomyces cavernae]
MVRQRGILLSAALTGGMVLAVGCSADKSADRSNDSPKQRAKTVAAAPANIEKIADLTDCRVSIRSDNTELREGVCKTDLGDYLITTFPQEKFKKIWLDTASMYGGKYLVGPRWAITAEPALLGKLRKKVGGWIEDTSVRPSQGTGSQGTGSQGPAPQGPVASQSASG